MLTNEVVSFEQPGPVVQSIVSLMLLANDMVSPLVHIKSNIVVIFFFSKKNSSVCIHYISKFSISLTLTMSLVLNNQDQFVQN